MATYNPDSDAEGLWLETCAFFKGMWEFRQSFTWHYASQELTDCYDMGREFAHLVTLRRFED